MRISFQNLVLFIVLIGNLSASLVVAQSPQGIPAEKGPVATGEVPDLVGQSEARARRAISRLGFEVGEITTAPSSTVAEGLIISQDPAAGAEAVLGSMISIVISSGGLTLWPPLRLNTAVLQC